MKVIPLRTRESDGPAGDNQEQNTPCTVCARSIAAGQDITYFRGWAHAKCVTEALLNTDAANAWIVLGAQLARRPSAFNATEIRAIVGQLLALAGDLPVEVWRPPAPSADERLQRAQIPWAT